MGLLEGLRGEDGGGDFDAQELVVANSELRVEILTEHARIDHARPKPHPAMT